MTNQLKGRVKFHLSDPLFATAYSLMANTILTAMLGVAFWVVAARLYTSELVGKDSALISAMTGVAGAGMLNLGAGLVRFLPGIRRSSRAIAGAYAVGVVAGLVAAIVFLVVVPHVSHRFRFLIGSWQLPVVFSVSVALWGIFALQDSALTGLRRAAWVPLENATFGILKLAALPILLAVGSSHAVFVAWVIPMVLLLLPVNYVIFRHASPSHARALAGVQSVVGLVGRRRVLGYLAQDYTGFIMGNTAVAMLPVLVVALLGSRRNAYFYVPFSIVTAFDLLALQVGNSLTVEGAHAEDRVGELARKVVARFVFILIPGVVVLVAAAPVLLLGFGHAYSRAGAQILRLLACASIFRAAISIYLAVCRVQRRGLRILEIQAGVFGLLIALVIVLGKLIGTTGIALGWLIANGAVALVILPSLVRIMAVPSTVTSGVANTESLAHVD